MILSVHHYELAKSADPSEFQRAVEGARERALFEGIPGLVDYHIGRGIKGERSGTFAAVWIYESRAAWEAVWGPVDDPVPKSEYPEAWLVWEDEPLDPVLAGDPDRVRYTAYESIVGAGADQ